MEALNFLMFWRPTNNTLKENRNQFSSGSSDAAQFPNPSTESNHDIDEAEDSFIDLELPLHDFVNERSSRRSCLEDDGVNDNSRFHQSNEEKVRESAKNAGGNDPSILRTTRSLSPSDHISKRKIIPIEPSSKPQSPIALLKSAPTFRVFAFKKSKSMPSTSKTERAEKPELIGVPMETPKDDKLGSKHFLARFRTEEAVNVPTFSRGNSLRKIVSISQKQKTEDLLLDDSSKLFSKDMIQKYLNLIKPLYVKVSKRPSDKSKFSGDLSMPSPASSPAAVFSQKEKQGNIPAGFRGVSKHLGKSRSASAASSPVSRRDDLLIQHDGIQSAIQHCKKSFNSSRESSLLSTCSCEYSSEKLSNASSTDSSLFSGIASPSSSEK